MISVLSIRFNVKIKNFEYYSDFMQLNQINVNF